MTSYIKDVNDRLSCLTDSGRMAPPVKEAPTKVVKVATTVAKRQSSKSEETSTPTPSAVEDDLHLTVLEESFQKAHTSYERRRALVCDTRLMRLSAKIAAEVLLSPISGQTIQLAETMTHLSSLA